MHVAYSRHADRSRGRCHMLAACTRHADLSRGRGRATAYSRHDATFHCQSQSWSMPDRNSSPPRRQIPLLNADIKHRKNLLEN